MMPGVDPEAQLPSKGPAADHHKAWPSFSCGCSCIRAQLSFLSRWKCLSIIITLVVLLVLHKFWVHVLSSHVNYVYQSLPILLGFKGYPPPLNNLILAEKRKRPSLLVYVPTVCAQHQALLRRLQQMETFSPCAADKFDVADYVIQLADEDITCEYAIVDYIQSLKDDSNIKRCFQTMHIRQPQVSSARSHYRLSTAAAFFWQLLDADMAKSMSYRYFFQMESDVFILKDNFLDRLQTEITANEPFWVLGSAGDFCSDRAQRFDMGRNINGNGVYNVHDPQFKAVLEVTRQSMLSFAFDEALYLQLKESYGTFLRTHYKTSNLLWNCPYQPFYRQHPAHRDVVFVHHKSEKTMLNAVCPDVASKSLVGGKPGQEKCPCIQDEGASSGMTSTRSSLEHYKASTHQGEQERGICDAGLVCDQLIGYKTCLKPRSWWRDVYLFFEYTVWEFLTY